MSNQARRKPNAMQVHLFWGVYSNFAKPKSVVFDSSLAGRQPRSRSRAGFVCLRDVRASMPTKEGLVPAHVSRQGWNPVQCAILPGAGGFGKKKRTITYCPSGGCPRWLAR